MAQIDHSENPGKGSALLSQKRVLLLIQEVLCVCCRMRQACHKNILQFRKDVLLIELKTILMLFACFASKQICIAYLHVLVYCGIDFLMFVSKGVGNITFVLSGGFASS